MCQTCRQNANITSHRQVFNRDLPPILAFNASVYNEDATAFWQNPKNQPPLPAEVEIDVERGQQLAGSPPVRYRVRVRISTSYDAVAFEPSPFVAPVVHCCQYNRTRRSFTSSCCRS